MTMSADIFSTLSTGLMQVAFPSVCLCCGHTVRKKHPLCSFCLEKRFEKANPDYKTSSAGLILPHKVRIQHALWQFYKGDVLQNVLHRLKYKRLTQIGIQTGGQLAKNAKHHPKICETLAHSQALLVPVPLHYLKFRKRGFNQAFSIARGIERVLGISICAIDTVCRQKYTRSQTGFSLEQRIQNMDEAFRVKKPEHIKDRAIIIIDDVFTTGSTSFELAKTLRRAGAASTMIWTVAQA